MNARVEKAKAPAMRLIHKRGNLGRLAHWVGLIPELHDHETTFDVVGDESMCGGDHKRTVRASSELSSPRTHGKARSEEWERGTDL